MRRNEWIHTLGTILLCAAFITTSSSQLLARELLPKKTAGNRPSFNLGNNKWKHVPSKAKPAGNIGSSPSIGNPFSGRSLPKLSMPSMPKLRMPSMPKVPGFGENKLLGPKVIMKEDNYRYLHRSGPVNVKFDGYTSMEFDRNDIIYVEHQGQFPTKGTELPSPIPTKKAEPAPPPVIPPPTQGVGETVAPVQISTKEPTLPELLNSAYNINVFPTAGGLQFHKKIDGVSPNSQEIITPFITPYNATPPAVSIKGRATYIRE
jgi:hypothetical protein